MVIGFTFLRIIKATYLYDERKNIKHTKMKKSLIISLSKENGCFYFIIFHSKLSRIYVFYKHAHFFSVNR